MYSSVNPILPSYNKVPLPLGSQSIRQPSLNSRGISPIVSGTNQAATATKTTGFFSTLRSIFSSPNPNQISNKVSKNTVQSKNTNHIGQNILIPKNNFDSIKNVKYTWSPQEIQEVETIIYNSLDKPINIQRIREERTIESGALIDAERVDKYILGGMEIQPSDRGLKTLGYLGDQVIKMSNLYDQNIHGKVKDALIRELQKRIGDGDILFSGQQVEYETQLSNDKVIVKSNILYKIQVLNLKGMEELGSVTITNEISAKTRDVERHQEGEKLNSLQIQISHSDITSPSVVGLKI